MEQHVIPEAPLQAERLAALRADEDPGLVDDLVSFQMVHRAEHLTAVLAAHSFLSLDPNSFLSY